VRELRPEEIERINRIAANYAARAKRYKTDLKPDLS
jgi:hypothetical protein